MFLVFYLPRNLKAAFNAVGSVAKLSREQKFRSPELFIFLQNFLQYVTILLQRNTAYYI